jgi:hypothetical protein
VDTGSGGITGASDATLLIGIDFPRRKLSSPIDEEDSLPGSLAILKELDPRRGDGVDDSPIRDLGGLSEETSIDGGGKGGGAEGGTEPLGTGSSGVAERRSSRPA